MDKELILRLGEQFKDPFRHLYFDRDTEEGGVGLVSVGRCRWSRDVSNDNINNFGFSFYYARHIFIGYVRSVKYPCWHEWFGFPFECRELGMIKIEGLNESNNDGDWWRYFTSSMLESNRRSLMAINGWVELYGLKSSRVYK